MSSRASLGLVSAKSERQAARETVAAYHETQLAVLVERVGAAVDHFRGGQLSAFDVDQVHFSTPGRRRSSGSSATSAMSNSPRPWCATHTLSTGGSAERQGRADATRAHRWRLAETTGKRDPRGICGGLLGTEGVIVGVRRGRMWLAVALVATATTVALFVLIGPGLVQTWLYDNRPSGVACEDLPTRFEVEAALAEHPDLVRRIQDLDPAVEVLVSEPCQDLPGAAAVLVIYPGGDLRERIEQLLAEETFEVPTTLRNV